MDILLIEDNPGDVLLLQEYLKQEGIGPAAVPAETLGEGLALLRQGRFDVVLLDLSLPDGEGLALVERLRGERDIPPVVILTGREDEELALQTLQKGVQDYLPKNGLTPGMLVRTIRYAVERRHFERRVHRASHLEAFGQLAEKLANDFNNLLTVIQGYNEMAMEQPDSRETAALASHEIDKASARAANLTRKLLAFGRVRGGTPENFDINKVLADTRGDLARHCGETVEVRLEAPPHPLRVNAAFYQVEQLLFNLGVNGAEAMPEGGVLTLGASRVEAADLEGVPALSAAAYVRISVRDTGKGIEPQLRQRIFEPFVTTKEDEPGAGLGLATVYGIVQAMQGHIEVESALGRGAEFFVYLPLDEGAGTPPGPAAGEKEKPPAYGGRLSGTALVVDDELVMRQMLSFILKKNGLEVFLAAGAEEAIEWFGRSGDRVDVLLTDILMPGVNGLEMVRRLHALRPDLKVLFVSGYSPDALAQEGLDLAGMPLLEKPFTPKQLLAALGALLR